MVSLVYIIGLACVIWVIYDVWAVNKGLSGGSKMIWTIFALFFSIITAVVYYFFGKKWVENRGQMLEAQSED